MRTQCLRCWRCIGTDLAVSFSVYIAEKDRVFAEKLTSQVGDDENGLIHIDEKKRIKEIRASLRAQRDRDERCAQTFLSLWS